MYLTWSDGAVSLACYQLVCAHMCFAESGVIIIIYTFLHLESADLKCVAVALEDRFVFAIQINDNASDSQQHFELHCSKRQ